MGENNIDWAAIAEDVAIRLLGEPQSRKPKELRWRRKGSFALYLKSGRFADFENSVSGGVIDMIVYLEGVDTRGAWNWLCDQGFVSREAQNRNQHTARREQARRNIRRRHPQSPKPHDPGALDYGLELWNESESIPLNPNHPVRKWVAHRNLLAPETPIPPCIRYHRRKGYILAIMASLKAWGNALPTYLPTPEAIHVIAIDNEGNKRFAWGDGKEDKRIFGRSNATLVVVIGEKDGERVNICEGLADALAVHCHAPGPCVATVTTVSKIQDQNFLAALAKRTVHIYSDNDDAGQNAAQVLCERINQHGGTVKKHRDDTAKDPAEASKGK